jgi:hypothetical protein
VIEVASRQRHIRNQHVDGVHQNNIEFFAVPSGFLALVVALEAIGVPRAFFVWAESNSPQEDSQKGGVERVFGV